MKKVIAILFLFSAQVWGSNCTEHASLLVSLKLKDMLNAYGNQHFYEITKNDQSAGFPGNIYNYQHLCKKSEIVDTIIALKKEHFKFCKLKSVAESLPSQTTVLSGEGISKTITQFIDQENCSPKIYKNMEDNIYTATKKIEIELKSAKTNVTKVCRTIRLALSENYELNKRCK
ncbi:hypothetical protein BIY24_10670 [Halobacteriovorax marinus]|uniref:hypothetical protein n=1 Tax=Halobacteriovorax marinus TaxID=97084 RepID=UPI000BC2C891|nr:hypothetical protein [Halobacteriovorax marinus]ATH08394.1 hypothetical protein BIY24_10670 [Halobacteriovorax marinus]